ncbi:hypothetical protein [Bailinhaonella thermotolerans]|nr:hypothetical protein [Bailinhaonella thermotolerans]
MSESRRGRRRKGGERLSIRFSDRELVAEIDAWCKARDLAFSDYVGQLVGDLHAGPGLPRPATAQILAVAGAGGGIARSVRFADAALLAQVRELAAQLGVPAGRYVDYLVQTLLRPEAARRAMSVVPAGVQDVLAFDAPTKKQSAA